MMVVSWDCCSTLAVCVCVSVGGGEACVRKSIELEANGLYFKIHLLSRRGARELTLANPSGVERVLPLTMCVCVCVILFLGDKQDGRHGEG